jgi:4-diphosphocytidyl-2-C-methyl-D-erythritol kinase
MFVKKLSSQSLVIGTPAKINLYLEVLRRRPDGYHEINSAFQAVSLFDRMRFTLTDSGRIEMELAHPVDLSTGEDNLVSRAYHLVRENAGVDFGLSVRLEKNIPIAAGLGGGSADAAATIVACNILGDLGLDVESMAQIGLAVGSDVPFFFSRGQAIVSGRGEIIREEAFPVDYWLVLVSPDFPISTRASYEGLNRDLTDNRMAVSLKGYGSMKELVGSLRSLTNDFEEYQFASFPALGRIREELLTRGAALARLSGSGPTIFGIFNEDPIIEHCECCTEGDWQVNTVRPIVLPTPCQPDAGGHRGDH